MKITRCNTNDCIAPALWLVASQSFIPGTQMRVWLGRYCKAHARRVWNGMGGSESCIRRKLTSQEMYTK